MLLLEGNNQDLDELQLDLQLSIFLSINNTTFQIAFVFSLFNKIIIKFSERSRISVKRQSEGLTECQSL